MSAVTRPTKEQLAKELAAIMHNGVGRSLKDESKAEDLAAVARELASDPDQPLPQLIAEIVFPAVRRLAPDRREAAACLLWMDLEAAKPGGQPGSRKPIEKRDDEAAALLDYAVSSFRRYLRRPLLEDVAEQILALLAAHRVASKSPKKPARPDGGRSARARVRKRPLRTRVKSRIARARRFRRAQRREDVLGVTLGIPGIAILAYAIWADGTLLMHLIRSIF